MSPRINDVIYWVRSTGPKGKVRIPMYFRGCLPRATDDGDAGDIRTRPTNLGPGPHTATYAPDSFEYEDGSPVEFD